MNLSKHFRCLFLLAVIAGGGAHEDDSDWYMVKRIRSYHIHVLSDNVTFLEALRAETLATSFYGVSPLPRCVTISRDTRPCTFRVNTPGGPFLNHHYAVHFPADRVSEFVEFFMPRALPGSLLFHPNSGNVYADHVSIPWWKERVPLNATFLQRFQLQIKDADQSCEQLRSVGASILHLRSWNTHSDETQRLYITFNTLYHEICGDKAV